MSCAYASLVLYLPPPTLTPVVHAFPSVSYEVSSLEAVEPVAAEAASSRVRADGNAAQPVKLTLRGHGFVNASTISVQVTTVFRGDGDDSSDDDTHLGNGRVGGACLVDVTAGPHHPSSFL